MKLLPTRYFSSTDLEPVKSPKEKTSTILTQETLKKIQLFTDSLSKIQHAELSEEELIAQPELAVYISVLHSFGIINTNKIQEKCVISISGQLACNVGSVLFLVMKHGFQNFNDWTRRYRTIPDKLCSLEFLHHMELERIDQSIKYGIKPEV